MATIERNRSLWNGEYDWSEAGEEWSRRYGNSTAQWWWSLMPRIQGRVPAGTILEIAPGFGRWSRFLRPLCQNLILVDLSEECIAACRAQFKGDSGVTCHVNDGRSLIMVPDQSVDFVFSFDSLVHVEADTIAAYLREIAIKLRPGGAAFIHHSNLGEYKTYYQLKRSLPKQTGPILQRVGMLDNDGFRGISMTAARFSQLANDAGLTCVSQEKINWGSRRLIDCISVVVPGGVKGPQTPKVLRNHRFESGASQIRQLSTLYSNAEA